MEKVYVLTYDAPSYMSSDDFIVSTHVRLYKNKEDAYAVMKEEYEKTLKEIKSTNSFITEITGGSGWTFPYAFIIDDVCQEKYECNTHSWNILEKEIL